MKTTFTLNQFIQLGLKQNDAQALFKKIEIIIDRCDTNVEAWQEISKNLLTQYPFEIHLFIFTNLFPNWPKNPSDAVAVKPADEIINTANITHFMKKLNFTDVSSFHHWSYTHYQDFWQRVIVELNIVFQTQFKTICDLSNGVISPNWFLGGKLNITDSCFNAKDNEVALIYQNQQQEICKLSYAELNNLVDRVASSLINLGYAKGDCIGIIMQMTVEAVAIYLGIIKMGGIVVSIADSFSSDEIRTRLTISNATLIFTQSFTRWAGKISPLYEKVKKSYLGLNNKKIKTIVVPDETIHEKFSLDKKDLTWNQFLTTRDNKFKSVACDPMDPSHLLFSSGTTAEPKAIIWNHTTGIKAASDAFFHQNIKPKDILCWPTNLGWMMGPWLIFAALINKATIALYPDAPKDREFGEFVQNAKVTMLGVVPTLVASFRKSRCMEKLNWASIKIFSSTGECSNPEDMLYLMSLANYKPIIEYCGGTEIGGAYVSSTIIQDNIPSLFSTPAMGLNFLIINDEKILSDVGEVAIIPPSIGLSTVLWNANHDEIYFNGMPKTNDGKVMRRHGDQIKRFPNGYYALLGRLDDTMNLGGIKISAAEIERTLSHIPNVFEVAAIAYQPKESGRSVLIIYASLESTKNNFDDVTTKQLDKEKLKEEMQKSINEKLNPLFRIYDVVLVNELPKTASNKIMRRLLRKKYLDNKEKI